MKKVLQILISFAFILSLLLVPSIVSATSMCPSGFSGPDSDNMCKSINKFTCHVENTNRAVIDNDNTQVAISGNAQSGGGDARTGSATNSNKVTFKVTVTNGEVCEVAAVTPAVNQGQGAAGGGAGAGVGAGAVFAASNIQPAVLPNTSSDVAMSYLIFVAESLGVAVIAACIAAVLYRRWQM